MSIAITEDHQILATTAADVELGVELPRDPLIV